MGEDRAKPVRVEEAFEPYKVPHQRRYTENPFDAQHILMGEHHDFGPKRGPHVEGYHYHGVFMCFLGLKVIFMGVLEDFQVA